MLSSFDYVRQSLELHLFFTRIMKEHSFFLEAGFTPRDASISQHADEYRKEFDSLLREVIPLSHGVVSASILQSGEVFTPYTLKAETASSYVTGVQIATDLTQAEEKLSAGTSQMIDPSLENKVYQINQKAIRLISGLIQFKTSILNNVLACKMFTVNYPLLIDHILREAKLYLHLVQRLENRQQVDIEKESLDQEVFWNRIMAEHSKFIRGLLDPTENDLFNKANQFGNEFDLLTAQAKAAMDQTMPTDKVTRDSMQATMAIRDFKTAGTEGLIDCKIKSIILPLLGDHTLREANHYLRLLKIFSRT